MVNEQSQNRGWDQEELNSKRVMVAVVRSLKFKVHQINCSVGGCYEHELHDTIVG